METTEQINTFKELFEENKYKARLKDNLRKGNNFLELDFEDLSKHNLDLANLLLDGPPEEIIKAAELAISDLNDKKEEIQVLFYNFPESTLVPLNEISDQLDRFLTFEGYVMKPSDIFLKCKSAKFECPACGQILSVLMIDHVWKEPSRCGCGRKGKFHLLSKKLIRFQRMELLEAMDKVPDKPRKLIKKQIFIAENLTRKDINEQLQPGQKVKIYGYLKLEEIRRGRGNIKSNEFKTSIEANNIIPIEQSWGAIKLNSKQIKKIKDMAKNKNLLDEFAQSLAPSFEGYIMPRKSLILQHVGGKRIIKNGVLQERECIQVLMSGPPGCQPAGSKVLMANGDWKNIEDIKLGELILSPQEDNSYEFSKVTNITSWESNENYNIVSNRKNKKKLYACSYNHLIPVNHRYYPRNKGIRKSGEYKNIIKHFTARDFSKLAIEGKKHNNIGFTCPEIKSFYGVDTDFEIEPYSLGVYISDGMFSLNHYSYQKNCSKLMICSMDKKVIDEVLNYYPCDYIYNSNKSKANQYYFSLKSEFARLLIKYGFKGKKSGEKFIPKQALLSSIVYRKKLLAGLIDSDGHVSVEGKVDFITKSEKLSKDIRFLVYSLGGTATINHCKKGIKKLNFEGKYYRIYISIDLSKLPLKKFKTNYSRTKLGYNRISMNAELDKPQKVYGLALDSKSKWYITDNFMVTHNSGKTYLQKSSLIISPLWHWTTGAGLTKVGLVASVIRDKDTGSYNLEIGPFVMADKGILGIDEMDKMNKGDYGMLNNGMNDEQTKITKANIDQTLRTRTSVLATSNPLHKKFVEEETIMKQLAPIPKDVLDRFDVIWPMKEELDEDKLSDKYMARHRKNDEGIKQIWSNDEMQQYISYSKKLIPQIDKPMEKYFNEKFKKLTGKSIDEEGEKSGTSHRLRGNILRWVYAHSKFIGIGKENKDMEIPITKESIDFAFSLMRYSFELLQLISQEGFVKHEDMEEIPSKKEISNYYAVKNALKKLSKEMKIVPEEDIIKEAQKEKEIDPDEVYAELEKLSRAGDAFTPVRGKWQLI